MTAAYSRGVTLLCRELYQAQQFQRKNTSNSGTCYKINSIFIQEQILLHSYLSEMMEQIAADRV
jgi:hypothetical protein